MKLVAAALVALGLAACGEPQSPAGPASAPAPAAPAFTAEQNAAAIAALPAPLDHADYENGRRVFAQCRSCHLVQAGAGNRVGPNLHGVIGAPSGGHSEGFRYSPAMKAANLTWDVATIDRYLENPRAVVPGTQMAFVGLREPEDRRDVIAYIAVESQR
jgi:cytochrome c